ncbi:MAG: M50 family metallopeptidase [Oscillospiraceae bacterium]
MQIVIAILAFCALIIIHEFGHFIAAKLCGIQVNEFALGMGPVILRKKGRETNYVIRLLPIGGSVMMEGEVDDSDNPRAFNRKPVWQRMIVILAGPVMNLLLGFFTLMIYICSANVIGTTVVSSFPETSLCSEQLMVGDEIVAMDNTSVWTTYDIQYKLQNNSSRINEAGNLLMDFRVKRDGQVVDLKDVEFELQQNKNGSTDVLYGFYVLPLERNFGSVIGQSFRQTVSVSRMIIFTFADLFKGKYGVKDMSGPVGTVTVVSKSVSMGLPSFMYMLSFITVNVGIFNLIPIPALDGCRFLFLIIEAIRRKPLKPEVEGVINLVGFGLLMVLMLVVTFGDISKLASGGF